jgi:hypothetical protein
MEEIILNIDSRYRNIVQFPDESKFRINFEKSYKNIISARVITSEINNNVKSISCKKNNNWFMIYLPNKINDPEGVKIQLEDDIKSCQIIEQINILFDNLFNNNSKLLIQNVDNKVFAEKYFYFYYLNNKITINFSFNSYTDDNNFFTFLNTPLTINEGYGSVYGLFTQISSYVKNNYDTYVKEYNKRERDYNKYNQKFKNPGLKNNLYNGYFDMSSFSLNIYDRRNRDSILDCIRIDNISAFTGTTNITTNINNLKNSIYSTYISDTTTFVAISSGTEFPILDRLMGEDSHSKYHINNTATFPSSLSVQTYNLRLDCNNLILSFNNSFNNFMYYDSSGWDNNIVNLLDKNYLLQENFITINQYNDQTYIPTLIKDIPSFEIDFIYSNPMDNGLLNINKLNYQSLGYFLGFRPKLDNFLLSSKIYNCSSIMKAQTYYSFIESDYIFIRINDWGYINFYNQILFTKVILDKNLINYDKSNREYKFRQPINIQKLDIELVDYLGNTVDMNGYDYSFSLQLMQIINTEQKFIMEKESRIFTK